MYVFGGSIENTGSPFHVAMASLRTGSEKAAVICIESAAIPIKSYSPDIIVYPYLEKPQEFEKIIPQECAIVLGPGLGRDEGKLEVIKQVLRIVQ